MKTVYISGAYTADNVFERDLNVKRANEEAIKWAEDGWAPYCPHTQSRNWENDSALTYDEFLAIDKEWIKRCDAIAMLPGWQASNGARKEHQWAIDFGVPRYYCYLEQWEGLE